jgi:hypothetical protein
MKTSTNKIIINDEIIKAAINNNHTQTISWLILHKSTQPFVENIYENTKWIKFVGKSYEDEIHHHTLKWGLNIFPEKFIDKKSIFNCTGYRIYSQNILTNFIPTLHNNPEWIHEIYLPFDNPQFKILKHSDNIFHVNQLILGSRYPMYCLKTAAKFNIPISFNYQWEIIKRAVKNNDFKTIDEIMNGKHKSAKYTHFMVAFHTGKIYLMKLFIISVLGLIVYDFVD